MGTERLGQFGTAPGATGQEISETELGREIEQGGAPVAIKKCLKHSAACVKGRTSVTGCRSHYGFFPFHCISF
jgi:hypothetical protein